MTVKLDLGRHSSPCPECGAGRLTQEGKDEVCASCGHGAQGKQLTSMDMIYAELAGQDNRGRRRR